MSFLTQPVTIQSIFGDDRVIGPINVQVVISETTNDTLTITKQPVQQGASITDHSFKEPTAFSMTMLFDENITQSLSKVYQDLLDLQNLREPFTIFTPKRIYENMLISTLGLTTDKHTENILSITAAFQEVIIVSVTTTTVPRSKQRNPGSTGATQPAGKKSALQSLKEGIGAIFQ